MTQLMQLLSTIENRIDERTTLAGISVEDDKSRIPMEPGPLTQLCRRVRALVETATATSAAAKAVLAADEKPTIGTRLRTLKVTYGGVYRGGVAHRMDPGVKGVVVQMNCIDYDSGVEITISCDKTHKLVSLTKPEEYEVID